MLRALLLAAATILAGIHVAAAADLTDGDYRVLVAEYGLKQESWMIMEMSADERSALHQIMNDPNFARFPKVRADNTANFLYQIHIRECESWRQSHGGGQMCPTSGDRTLDLGQSIAEWHCNFCHLFGTFAAPTFHQLASRGDLTQPRLAEALARGHKMSPIGLQPEEITALFNYITSLR